MRFILLLCFGIIAFATTLHAQDTSLPPVINVAKNSTALDELSNNYQSSLFSASKADFMETGHNWRKLLLSMEQYADKIDFDIKGVKVWIKVFWDKEGNVEHIAYALSDRSINIDLVEWEAFLRSFIRNNKLPLQHSRSFTYDGRVMFPLSYAPPSQK